MPRVSQARTLAGSWALPASVMLVAAVAPFERALPGSALRLHADDGRTDDCDRAGDRRDRVGAGAGCVSRGARRSPCRSPRSSRRDCRGRRRARIPGQCDSRRRAPGDRGAVVHPGRQCRQERSRREADRRSAARRRHRSSASSPCWSWRRFRGCSNALKAFRPGFHVVGGQLRATSTLFYPTITSMFLEVAFALGLVWIASSRARVCRPRAHRRRRDRHVHAVGTHHHHAQP